jgi:transposase InsO family protein
VPFSHLPRSTFYYAAIQKPAEKIVEKQIEEIFRANREAYGSRKIKVELRKAGLKVCRRRICRIMARQDLVSKYAVAKFKVHQTDCNEEDIGNKLNRQFDSQVPYAAVISDWTYVRVGGQWNYICFLVDLFNREIIGYSAG